MRHHNSLISNDRDPVSFPPNLVSLVDLVALHPSILRVCLRVFYLLVCIRLPLVSLCVQTIEFFGASRNLLRKVISLNSLFLLLRHPFISVSKTGPHIVLRTVFSKDPSFRSIRTVIGHIHTYAYLYTDGETINFSRQESPGICPEDAVADIQYNTAMPFGPRVCVPAKRATEYIITTIII